MDKAIQDPIFTLIGEEANRLGVSAFVIGGYVRDYFLQRPNKDIDIMSVGRGIDLAEAVAKRLGSLEQLVVYKNFGTALLKTAEWEIEFVGARKESYRNDSRKPVVEDGTLEDDIGRRDFTINAMGIALHTGEFGKLIDLYDGTGDLERKCIRTPLDPDITFSDDPLRMLRAIRFSTQLNFKIDPESLDAIQRNAERISIISKERIAEELHKIILAPVPSQGFKLLFNTGLLHLIFPEMVNLHGVEYVNGRGHKDNFYHTLQVLDNLSQHSNNLWLRWAAILHDIAKPATKRYESQHGWTFHGHEEMGAQWVPRIFRKMGLPQNEKMKFVQKMVRLHLRPIALVKENITDSALRRLVFDAGEDLEDLMLLCHADITSKNAEKVKKYLRNYAILEIKLKEIEEKDHIRNFQPPVTGEMIMEIFDVPPGKFIGDLKTALKNAILDGEVTNTYAECLDFVIKEAEKHGIKPKKG